MGISPCWSKELLNRGAWTAQEDKLLRDYISAHGEGKWSKLPQRAGLKRCGKSCRLRWLNYLRPNIKRGNISKEEEDLIIRLHNLLGNRWSLIAGRIPGRTDNEIKNYWNTTLGKRVDRHNRTSTASTEENINMRKTKSQSTLVNASPSFSLSPPKLDSHHSNVLFRTKASKCSKSLFIDPIFPHSPIMQLQGESNKAPEHGEGHVEPSSLLMGDDDDAANNNISATTNNEIETVVYDNEILSFPSEEDKELSMDLLFDCGIGDVCFSDLLNLDFSDFSDACDDLGNNNSNSREDILPLWDKPLASSLEIDPRSDFCDETSVAK